MKLFIKIFILFLVLSLSFGYYFSQPTLSEMTGQMIITGFRGDGTDKNNPDFVAITNQIKKKQIGGVILFDTSESSLLQKIPGKHNYNPNIKSVSQVKNLTNYLQSLSSTKLFIAIDQEGGAVQRLKPEHGFISTPSAQEMAKENISNTYDIAYNMGTKLSEIGINTNFAPVLDINVNPESETIGKLGRSFSNNADIVIEHGTAFAKGLTDANIINAFKHFPGYGSTTANAHYKQTDITNTYTDYELKPWQTVLKNQNPLSMVMMSHVVNQNIDFVPASLSAKTIKQIRDFGFDGVIISDDIDMLLRQGKYDTKTTIKMAINAGNDILLFNNRNFQYDKDRGQNINKIIIDMVKSGEIPKTRIKESYNRIIKLKKHINNKHLRLEKNNI